MRLKQYTLGCTAFCNNPEGEYKENCNQGTEVYPYPYSSNPVIAPVQTYYLLDVVSQEMSPSPSWMPIPVALRAQAIAARSYGWYQYEFNKPVNNSNSFQVFVPYRFDKLNLNAAPMEPRILTPCDPDRFRNEPQELACDAIAPQHYLSSWNDDLPAFSEFSADVADRTTASSDPRFPYLASVQDPISAACDASDDGHGRGMSQWGADRWALGDQCALAGNGSDPWSVVWTRAEQILFHYYTGVQLRDADNDKKIISPDWRWNPLDIRWNNTPSYEPPSLQSGTVYTMAIQLQNTGINSWPCRVTVAEQMPIPPGFSRFYLRYRWARPNGQVVIGTGQVGACGLTPGQAKTVQLTLNDVPLWPAGTYTLSLDIQDADRAFWFSTGGWPTYDIAVKIIAPPTPTPRPSPTVTVCPGC